MASPRSRRSSRAPVAAVTRRSELTATTARGTGAGEARISSIGDYEDALPRALLGRLGHCGFELRRDRAHLGLPPRLVEDGVALLHVGQAVVAKDEDCGTDLPAQSVPRAQLLVDPHLHELTSSEPRSASTGSPSPIVDRYHLRSPGPIGPTISGFRSLPATGPTSSGVQNMPTKD